MRLLMRNGDKSMLRKIIPAMLLLVFVVSCNSRQNIESTKNLKTQVEPSITQTSISNSDLNVATATQENPPIPIIPSATPNNPLDQKADSPQIELFVTSMEINSPVLMDMYVPYKAGTKVLMVEFGATNRSQKPYIYAFQEQLVVNKCNWYKPVPTLYTNEGSSYPYTDGYAKKGCGMGNVIIQPGETIRSVESNSNPKLSYIKPFGLVYFQFPETETPEKILFHIGIFDDRSVPVEEQDVWLDLSNIQ